MKDKRLVKLLLFLLGLVGFNALFFLPEYMFLGSENSWWPTSTLQNSVWGDLQLIWVRNNFDVFRWLGEWGVLVMLIMHWPHIKNRPWTRWIFFSLYCLLLIYHVYYIGSIKIYGEAPILANDLQLLKEVVPLFLGELGVLQSLHTLGFVLILLLTLLGLAYLFKYWIHVSMNLPSSWRILITILCLLGIAIKSVGIQLMYQSDEQDRLWKSLRWVSGEIVHSLRDVPPLVLNAAEPWSMDSQYDTLPNIYLLFIESYGTVVQLLVEEGPMYASFIRGQEERMDSLGYSMRSGFTKSPIIGGRSWLAFTSALVGTSINSHVGFKELMTQHYNYPHLVRQLKNLGYQTYRMKTMSNQSQSTDVSYALMERFYAFDRWIKYDDFGYRGYQYDHLGGLPDQYAINYFYEEALTAQRPFFLFSINMSSHAPWHPVPPILSDWRELDSIQESPDGRNRSLDGMDESLRYYQSIQYALQVVFDFIHTHGKREDLFILLGDHQPPGMTFLCEGIIDEYAVPFHILSKNPERLQSDMLSGTKPQLLLDPHQDPVSLRHQDFFPLILDLLK